MEAGDSDVTGRIRNGLRGFSFVVLGLFADFEPVLFANVFVDGDWAVAVEAVGAVLFGAGDPEELACFFIDVVVFVAVAYLFELTVFVIEGALGF